MKRAQKDKIVEDLAKKIVFLVGPRQVGKTWLAKEISHSFGKSVYLNYDRLEDREIIKNEAWLPDTELLILDELHKMPKWKNFLKGVFDTKTDILKILVTGSARVDTFRQAGDSLAGRYFVHHLLPFSLSELKDVKEGQDIGRFLERGGFPEPFLVDSKEDASRWRMQYVNGLIRNDILDFEKIDDLRAMELIFDLLRSRVGSLLSLASLARDANISPNTVKRYISILEALYIIFLVRPYASNVARSIVRTPKVYFFDNGLVRGDVGAKLENFVAVSLLKHVLARRDYQGVDARLMYMRTKEGKEVDFCLVEDQKPAYLLEVKYADKSIDKSLQYFSDKYHLAGSQLIQELKHERQEGILQVRKATNYLRELS